MMDEIDYTKDLSIKNFVNDLNQIKEIYVADMLEAILRNTSYEIALQHYCHVTRENLSVKIQSRIMQVCDKNMLAIRKIKNNYIRFTYEQLEEMLIDK